MTLVEVRARMAKHCLTTFSRASFSLSYPFAFLLCLGYCSVHWLKVYLHYQIQLFVLNQDVVNVQDVSVLIAIAT